MMKKYRVPCVLVGKSLDDGQEDSVVWDNYTGAKLATNYLISLGCRRILCLLGGREVSTSHERHKGYLDALREAQLPVYDELQLRIAPDRIVEKLREYGEPFDGIFAFSDPFAWKAATIFRDIPIIGFDNVKSSLTMPFAIPSIAADLDLEASCIVDLLLKRIVDFDRPVSKKVIPVKLVL